MDCHEPHGQQRRGVGFFPPLPLGLESAKVAVLDEWRFDETVVPMAEC